MTHSTKSKHKPKPEPQLRFTAIGTQWRICMGMPLPAAKLRSLQLLVQRRIAAFDRQYSRFRPDSLVSEMARHPGTYRLLPDARPMLDLYADLYQLTAGAVTPLVGQLLADAGYDASYSFTPGNVRRPPEWGEALLYQFPTLTVRQPVLLDFGAAGKGYLVDIIGDLLAQHGVSAYSIDAGGDIVHHGPANEPIRVGLEHPANPQQVIGVATIANQSICGSAPNRRAWGAYHHIMDPHSLSSPQHIRAVWVVADTGLLADALATCLFFVPPERLLSRYTFEYAIVAADFSLAHSAQFPATFFTAEGSAS
ncbi:MAG TPA: FAD:protein FMN transferase [Candidatus Saccharimonadales bacterium]|nr:FAD:protein FMN transferase [Candidatus Saccharimonadales bacterium]